MKTFRSMNPVLRATGVIGTVAALVTGITFAALSSQATLTANTISSGTADLQISTDAACVAGFSNSTAGYNFLVATGQGTSPLYHFCLKNAGTGVGLGTSVKLNAPVTFTDGVSPVTADSNKVHVNIACTTPTVAFTKTLAELATSQTVGTILTATTAACDASVTIDAGAFTGSVSHIQSSSFNLVFDATGV